MFSTVSIGHLEPLNQNPSEATLARLTIIAEFKMASKVVAFGIEIIEIIIFFLLFHPRNMMEWVSIAFNRLMVNTR